MDTWYHYKLKLTFICLYGIKLLFIYYLLTESEVFTGKSQNEALIYWLSDSNNALSLQENSQLKHPYYWSHIIKLFIVTLSNSHANCSVLFCIVISRRPEQGYSYIRYYQKGMHFDSFILELGIKVPFLSAGRGVYFTSVWLKGLRNSVCFGERVCLNLMSRWLVTVFSTSEFWSSLLQIFSFNEVVLMSFVF